MKRDITIGEKYGPAMAITSQAEADAYFEDCVAQCMLHGKSRADAIRIERQNLGYFAGYYDNETRERIERLFSCAHPVFGRIEQVGPPTAKEALDAGLRIGAFARGKEVGERYRKSQQ